MSDGTPVYANPCARDVFDVDATPSLATDADVVASTADCRLALGTDPVRAGRVPITRLDGRFERGGDATPLAVLAVAARWRGAAATLYAFDATVARVDATTTPTPSSSGPPAHQYQQAVESSTDLLAAVDDRLRFLFANRAYRSFHGLTADRVRDLPLRDLIGADAFERVEADLERALAGEVVRFEHSRARDDGEDRILDVRLFPLHDDGTIVGVGASMRDVTAERQRVRDLERLAEFRRVVATISDRLTRGADREAALESVVVEIAASDLFGCTFLALTDDASPEFVCSSDSSLTDADVAAFHTGTYVRAVQDAGVLEMGDVTTPPYDQHVTDRDPHAGVAVALEHEGEPFGVLTVHLPPGRDLGEVELRLLDRIADDLGVFLHTQSLGHELRTFLDIADQIEDPILLQDLEGDFVLANEALAEYADSTPAALVGQDESAFMDADAAAEIARRKREVLETEEPVHYKVQPSFPERGMRTFSTYRYPHYDADGSLDGTVAICRDVTEYRERERQVRVMDRVLRHNVSNRMNVVLGYAETIREITSDDRVRSYAAQIIESGEALVATTQKERAITKLLSEPPGAHTLDLAEAVREAVGAVERDHPGATIETALPSACRLTTTTDLGLAVEELLRNAVVHSDRDAPSVWMTLERSTEAVTLAVADDGPGIPEMERAILDGTMDVEPLYHGSGLGLWLVKLAADRADATLEYADRDPRGSIVRLHLSR